MFLGTVKSPWGTKLFLTENPSKTVNRVICGNLSQDTLLFYSKSLIVTYYFQLSSFSSLKALHM